MENKKIIDLEIIDDVETSGVQAIALVSEPAIEKNWLYFKKEEFIEPKEGQSKDEYLKECTAFMVGQEGYEGDQAYAICYNKWTTKMSGLPISFDYDDTFSTDRGFNMAKKMAEEGKTLYIISARDEVSDEMINRAAKIGIPKDRIFATGSNENKIKKINELNISKHIDNNADVIKELGTIGEKFEIDTSGLSPYTQQTKKEPFNYEKILELAEKLGFSEDDLKGNGIAISMMNEKMASEKSRERILYKYTGGLQDNSRDFCKRMVKMNKYYTFQEIQKMEMESVNPGFGIAGGDTYSIWDYKGGVNCKHFWKQFLITPFRSFEGRPADGLAGEKPIDMPNGARVTLNKMMFTIEDKMELVGPVAIPDIEIPRKGDNNDIYFVKFSKDAIQRMAQKFLKEGRVGDSNLQHIEDQDAGTYVYESWIVENEEDKANSVYGLNVPIGTWMVKMKVMDKGTWDLVKSGELRGFSLEGDFIAKEDLEKYNKEKKIFDDLRKLLK